MNTPTSKYIIKIDDDFKFVNFNGPFGDLEDITKKYYEHNEIKITYLPDKTDGNFIKSMIKPNSFFNNNDFDIDEFVEKIKDYTKLVDYFNVKFNEKIEAKNNITLPSMQPIPTQDLRGSISSRNPTPDAVKPILSNSDLIEGYVEPKFDGHMSLDDFNDTLLNSIIKCNIYYNNQFNNIFIIESQIDVQLSLQKNPLFQEFSLLFSNCKLNISKEERLKLTKEILVNEDDAKTKINKMINDTIVDSKLSINEMKELITKYFTITTNLENRVKFTNIWEIITSKLKISEPYVSYLKRQLPIILEDLKLQKKRYSDGIYWYGLVKRDIISETNMLDEIKLSRPIDDNTYTNYLKERDNEIKEAIPSLNEVMSHPDEFISKLIKKERDNEIKDAIPSLDEVMSQPDEFISKLIKKEL